MHSADPYRRALDRAHAHALSHLEGLDTAPVSAPATADQLRSRLRMPLPQKGESPDRIIDELAAGAAGGILGSTSGRFFGWVIGGSLPSALAADWLVSAWDQNAGIFACGPAVAVVEEVVGEWLIDLFGLPPHSSFALVTGCQMAHTTCLAAARHHVLAERGWDVQKAGLNGSPRIHFLTNRDLHGTVDRSLRLLGLGTDCRVMLDTDDDSRVRRDSLVRELRARSGEPMIVHLLAGEINTGAFDDFEELIPLAQEHGAWVHIDGAFGLWAQTSHSVRPLCRGVERADSWATDAHKWLNVPYDSGLAFVRNPSYLNRAMALSAAYIPRAECRDPGLFTPELSRRARGVEIWAALRSLGRGGLAEMIERTCAHARRFAEGLGAAGCEVLNEVVLNQVLVAFGDAETTLRVIDRIQREGTCWCGPTRWQGRTAMRISVASWITTGEDVERSLDAIVRAVQAESVR